VSLVLYDITGRLVRNLVDDNQPVGRYAKSWNGCDNSSLPVASGIYIISLKAGDYTFKRKITLMR